MTEPRRWLETGEAPPEVLALLRSAHPTHALDARAREQSRRRLSALAAIPAAAGTIMWLQHAAYGALLGAAVTGTVVVAPRLWSPGSPEPASPRPAVASRPAAHSVPESTPIAPSAAAPSGDAPALLEPRPPPVTRYESAEHELSREAKSLEHARALMVSAPAEALAAIRRHLGEFPHGTLEVEREFLEVEALVRLGRRSEAELAARALRARAPGSLYERRLEGLLRAGQ